MRLAGPSDFGSSGPGLECSFSPNPDWGARCQEPGSRVGRQACVPQTQASALGHRWCRPSPLTSGVLRILQRLQSRTSSRSGCVAAVRDCASWASRLSQLRAAAIPPQPRPSPNPRGSQRRPASRVSPGVRTFSEKRGGGGTGRLPFWGELPSVAEGHSRPKLRFGFS